MIVTEIAKTAKNPVFIPKIRKSNDKISPLLVAWEMDEKSIFSGDANLGTLRIAFTKNKTKREMDTFFTLFCNLGNLTRIALPKMIPWSNPIANALNTVTKENTGCKNRSEKTGISAIIYKANNENLILVTRNNNMVIKPKNC